METTKKPTEFEMKVYNTIANVPAGKVTTYKEVAKILNSSPRAVGNALAKNPFAPKIPCHRVVKSNGEVGGFGGDMNRSQEKAMILKSEGLMINENKVINFEEVLFTPTSSL